MPNRPPDAATDAARPAPTRSGLFWLALIVTIVWILFLATLAWRTANPPAPPKPPIKGPKAAGHDRQGPRASRCVHWT